MSGIIGLRGEEVREMGRASIKAVKTIYQQTRERLGLTREAAADLLDGMSADRIEKIENGRTQLRPEDVLIMAEGYKTPALKNYYCANDCPIGQKRVTQVTLSELPEIVLQMLASLTALQKKRDVLIEITGDGQIQDNEIPDFLEIQEELGHMAMTVEALQLWSEQMLAEDKINLNLYEQYKKKREDQR